MYLYCNFYVLIIKFQENALTLENFNSYLIVYLNNINGYETSFYDFLWINFKQMNIYSKTIVV